MSHGMMNNLDRLVYMANQIARNIASEPGPAATATAYHLRQFWDPHMKDQIIARAAKPDHGLSDVAAMAVAALAHDRAANEKPFQQVESIVTPTGGPDGA